MTDAEQSSAPISPPDTARAADADREATAEKLRIAAAEGRIDFEELDDRVGQAYSARTYSQVRALVADLPAQPASVAQHNAAAEPETLALKTTTPNIKQSGQWGWYLTHLAILVSPGLVALSCGRRLPHGC